MDAGPIAVVLDEGVRNARGYAPARGREENPDFSDLFGTQ